jgi:hypothetical protein
MRAKEFIREQRELPDESKGPMRHTYVIPGLSAADPYGNYRMGVAMARARSDYATELSSENKGIDPYRPEWSAETEFGEHAVVVGTSPHIAQLIDRALAMTKTPGGKRLVSSTESQEPTFVGTQSPVTAFKGYPR